MSYKRSFLILLLKKLMSALEVILPARLYRPLYGFAFASYKGLRRLFYFRHVIYYRLKRNSVNYRKASIVRRVMPYSLVGNSGLEATYDAAMKLASNHTPRGGLCRMRSGSRRLFGPHGHGCGRARRRPENVAL